MGIEIRPAAVAAQIERKEAELLAPMEEALAGLEGAVGASSSEALSGEGFSAARERMSVYLDLAAGMRAAVSCTRAADARVAGALSAFGGTDRVSEDEWLQKKKEAAGHACALSLRMLGVDRSSYVVYDALDRQKGAWLDKAQAAGEMLSRIYAYCEATNPAHGGALDDLRSAVSAGAAALAAAPYDGRTGRWPACSMGWRAKMRASGARALCEALVSDGAGEEDADELAAELAALAPDEDDEIELWYEGLSERARQALEAAAARAKDAVDGYLDAAKAQVAGFASGLYESRSKAAQVRMLRAVGLTAGSPAGERAARALEILKKTKAPRHASDKTWAYKKVKGSGKALDFNVTVGKGVKRAGKTLGRAVPAVSAVSAADTYREEYERLGLQNMDDDERAVRAGAKAGVELGVSAISGLAASAASSALIGAAAGSVVPGIGTVIGAAVGFAFAMATTAFLESEPGQSFVSGAQDVAVGVADTVTGKNGARS